MRPGGLFVAHVARRDGHDFVASAFANGARAALVSRVPQNLLAALAAGGVAVLDFRPGGAPAWGPEGAGERPLLLLVEQPLRALQGVAAWWRRGHRARVLAVAGAVGKTTTKELLANAVSRRYSTLRTAGNFNNELGLPITLLGLTAAQEMAVLEIGISEVGEMTTFAAVAGADVGVMTRIVPEHMAFLRDLDTVEREEGRLIEALPASGVAVLNADDPRVARMASRTSARVVRYGEGAGVDVGAREVTDHGLAGLSFTLDAPGFPGGPRPVRLPLVGRHFLTAALGAAGAAFAAGCEWEDVVAGLQQAPQTQRLAPRPLPGGVTVLDDAYNASPDSARAALDVLAAAPAAGGRRLALLGDMLEMGDYAPLAHREVGAHVPGRADVLVTVGDLGREIARAARAGGVPAGQVHECRTAEDAVSLLTHVLRPGDTLLVKASHGMHLETVIEALAGRTDRAG
ncbi:MAG TPA: UDP-N-acetylmuramoyl-tripeptide--D-alanyl-D-alanine ligase [Chloroflexota bacterium]|nr:UDP-N-acetylmuramoyl-tripeptide--D-alanyl-D-alanine ligase [Chloroflexota bacterium]